ncbi:DUF4328 domain-containing protein [Streptomyces sp. RKND-216]|uniref:DUF4328 domain-containing protein n=1 Tax=Streptomyces sp. RKND-216 TaxID=2562581 RepID=UPI00109E3447|nr:DUF4328 domain-containing protein [Streptomyces sp. RKND-216]THA24861.1 DUF4328 domain-containing protein [Streptomyces sp. RKND-216]
MAVQGDGGKVQPGQSQPYPAQRLPGHPGGRTAQHGPWAVPPAVPPAPPHPVTGLGNWTAGLLAGAAGLHVVGGLLMLLDAGPAAVVVLGLTSLWLVPCAVLVIVWLYRVRANVDHLDPYRWAGPRRLAKGWAIGSWFVPVGFLWLPLQVVLDVWWGTAEPRRERRGRTPVLIVAWWACWLLSWFTGFRLTHTVKEFGGNTFESHSVNVFPGNSLLSAPFAAAAAVLLLLLVRRVTTRQATRLVG